MTTAPSSWSSARWNGRAAFRQAVAELTDAYGGLPQFRGVSVDDADAYQAAGEYGPPW